MNKTEHTPTPWRIAKRDMGYEILGPAVNKAGDGVAIGLITKKANANFIIRTCNSYDLLIQALKDLQLQCIDEIAERIIEQALQKAGAI